MFRSNLHNSKKRTIGADRQGAAAVEAALCIPLVFLLMILTLAICSDIYLKETLTVAAFEGARAGVRRRATAEFSVAQAENILASRGIVGGVVTTTPENFENEGDNLIFPSGSLYVLVNSAPPQQSTPWYSPSRTALR